MNVERANILVGDAPPRGPGNDCGCFEGLSVETPMRVLSRAGLSSVAYRVGTHSRFKETMLARLSAVEFPALADLRTRDDDDFSVALLDAWATVCDVLTFYQERIANESYLRTAGERLSVLELARLLGYRPRPGVAAGTYLAFSLEEAPGAPEQALRKTTVPRGTRVNSVPGPGETQKTFETVEDIEARVEWNALKPRMTSPQRLRQNNRSAYLQGTSINLVKGDALLFVGEEREAGNAVSDQWDLRFVTNVEFDPAAGHTYIEWASDTQAENLHSTGIGPDAKNPKVYALRLRASLFGHNAIDPKLLHPSIWRQFDQNGFLPPQNKELLETLPSPDEHNVSVTFVAPDEWSFPIKSDKICLDNEYPGLLKGSWFVLSRPNFRRLFTVANLSSITVSEYGLSAKAKCVSLTGPMSALAGFQGTQYRKTAVFTASEELALAEAPLTEPVWKGQVRLNTLVEGMEPHQLVFVRGKRARVRVVKKIVRFNKFSGSHFFDKASFDPTFFEHESVDFKSLAFKPSSSPRDLSIGKSLTVIGRPSERETSGGTVRTWRLRDQDGIAHEVDEANNPFEFIAAAEDDETIVEAAHVKNLVREGASSVLTFESPLEVAYDRGSVEILANIALATHGETVSDILGSADASVAFQRFALRQKPLTYVSAPTASGAASTLEVRVGGMRWDEAPTLLGRGPQERVYTTRTDAEGNVFVEFGDGLTGARLPTGENNVQARYRKGIGLQGEVGAGQLSLLMDKPLGVRGVVNPVAASGSDDPESMDRARQNAPLGVLTLERAVSLTDYEDFARAFGGVAKALATWSWDGGTRRLFISVAGPNGNAILEDSKTFENLVNALKTSGDPLVSFAVASYRPALFKLRLSVTASVDRLPETVRAQVEAALRSAFGFAARSLVQPVHLSEVIEVVHGVPGVVAVDVSELYRTTPPSNRAVAHARLPAARPVLGPEGKLQPAELLLLDPTSLEEGLEVHR